MKLIVGLGNIGERYKNTRHNAGFLCADTLAKHHEANFTNNNRLQARISDKCHLDGQDFIIAKPTTFMNLSGDAVSKIQSYYKITPAETLICFDDIDLPFATLKLLPKGGSGTHNGMKSIIGHLGQEFPRLKIGIENRSDIQIKNQDLATFVLSKFTPEEFTQLENALEKSIKGIELFIQDDLNAAMNLINALA